MRIAIENVYPSINQDGSEDGYQGQHGWVPAFRFEGRALDDDHENKIREGDYIFAKGNFKNPPVVGTTENMVCKIGKQSGRKISFKETNEDGTETWWMVMERAKDMSRGGNPYNGPQRGASRPATPATPRPGSAPSGPANAPQAPSQRPVPTMAQAVAVLKECVAAVEGWGEAKHATTLFLGRLRGEIRANPSAAEVEAAAKAKAAEAQRLADEAERARQAALAAQAQAAPAGYAPADAPGADDEIPFGFAIMAGAASLLSLIANGGVPGVA